MSKEGSEILLSIFNSLNILIVTYITNKLINMNNIAIECMKKVLANSTTIRNAYR